MEFKGTKGKWEYQITPEYHQPKCSRIEIGSDENETAWICKVQDNGVIGKEEGQANALLISKAPEMLEMLESQLKLIRKIIRIKQIWLPKEPLTAEFSAEYIALSSMFNQLQEQEYQIEQLIKEATEL
jgi:light-regulated signal transduction histidine kinase (bacteriophytochrome)